MTNGLLRGLDIPELDFESIAGGLPSEETIQSVIEAVSRAQQRLERAREQAENHINIDPPWDYDTSEYSPSEEAYYHAFKWTREGQIALRETGDSDLPKLAERIEYGSEMFVEDAEDENVQNFNSGILVLISALDGLIIWLCEKDPNITTNRTNCNDEDIYHSGHKKEALEKWYDQFSIFGVEGAEGTRFKDKWSDFWEHRHRIMHGAPDAYYDDNVGVATLFFVGLTAHVVKKRYEALN